MAKTRAARGSAPRLRPAKPEVPEGWAPRITSPQTLAETIDRLPLSPGVYLMRDRDGGVVYVGKARRLRTRVRQYFTGQDTRDFVASLAGLLGDIETVVTSNDKEALLLENALIKQHRPRFNLKLRDDKEFLLLRLDTRAAWPRLELVRAAQPDGADYYGPYHSAQSARKALRVVNRHFQLRTCTDWVLTHRTRPCLQYQIGRCPAPCVYEVDHEAYVASTREVGLFLSGRRDELVSGLEHRMNDAAEALEFERAARIRDQVRSLQSVLEAQRVVGALDRDQDVVGIHREGGQVELVVMHVRRGRMFGTEAWSERGLDLPDAAVIASFLFGYYQRTGLIADEVLVPVALDQEDHEPLVEWLSEQRGKAVSVLASKRGDRRALLDLARENAANSFATRRDRGRDVESALTRLADRLHLSRIPHRIECFDISHIQGSDPVASMVVMTDGVADKAAYRTFTIKGPDGELSEAQRQNDDFLALYEVLSRRLSRGLSGDDERWALPDLLVIDGGKGQLGRVLAAMGDLGVPIGAEGVDVVALAKERDDDDVAASRRDRSTGRRAPSGRSGRRRPERVFIPNAKDPIPLADGSTESFMLIRLRDEAHRFAVEAHRKRRAKRAVRSRLDEIPGVGPSLRRALLRHFGSLAALRAADEAALLAVKGVGPAIAAAIVRWRSELDAPA